MMDVKKPLIYDSLDLRHCYGRIEPKDDPGLDEGDYSCIGTAPKPSQGEIQTWNDLAKNDTDKFSKGQYLPKGIFTPQANPSQLYSDKELVVDPNKPTLVISYLEDDLGGTSFFKAINKYFQLNPQIQKKYNVLVAWSTSLEDMIKTFKIIKNKIGGFSNAFTLFLNDLNINIGSGPEFTEAGKVGNKNLGYWATNLTKGIFGIPADHYMTICQTGQTSSQSSKLGNYQWTWEWSKLSPEEREDLIRKLSSDQTHLTYKLHDAIPDNLNEADKPEKIPGIDIPVQGFLRFLDTRPQAIIE